MYLKPLAALTATLLVCSSALAQTGSGGFTGPSPATTPHQPSASTAARGGFTGPATVVTVEQTKALADDAHVTLRGQIERHLGGENYLFRDATGTLEVEIDERRWNGQSVSPQDKVEISGEVDKRWSSIEIDVKRLRKL